MTDHLPEDLVRAEQIDDILAGICDEPCAVQDVASGCSCAMARQIVKNLQMEVVNHLGQIERLRAAADGARREAITECIGLANDVAAEYVAAGRGAVYSDKYAQETGEEAALKIESALAALLPTPPQPDPVAAAREAADRQDHVIADYFGVTVDEVRRVRETAKDPQP